MNGFNKYSLNFAICFMNQKAIDLQYNKYTGLDGSPLLIDIYTLEFNCYFV